MASESTQFQASRLASLNATQNNKGTWVLDAKYAQQMLETVDRVRTDLEEGILLHCQAVRVKQLLPTIAEKCFSSSNDLSFVHAKTCEEYMYEKDYKLNLMKSFFRDHMVRHSNEYAQCFQSEQFQSLTDMAAKDEYFLDCHNRWMRKMKEEVRPDLEEKAARIFL